MTPCVGRRNTYFIYLIITLSWCYGVLHEDDKNDKVSHIGDSVRLDCSTSVVNSSKWSHIPDGNKKRMLISSGDQLSQEYADNGRFRLDTSTGKYDLLINNLNQRDAGVYFCSNQESEHSTRLVIEKILRNLKETPTSVASVKGQDVRLNCATSYPHPVYWTHLSVGKSVAIEVYVVGVLIGSYASSGRYNVEVDASIGQYDLVIRQVQLEDAGTFVCIDDYGNGMQVAANVTVLDASPVCQSNASEVDGVLIENDCGLPPDLLHITCHTTFAGSAEPQLLLKHSGVAYDAIAKETTKSDSKDLLATVISQYILQPDFRMTADTDQLSCEVTGFNRVPSTIVCDIPEFKIHYIFNSTSISITKMLSPHQNEESFTCSSNSSESCSYKWIMPHRPEEVLSHNKTVSFGPGKYMCTAECVIRGKTCSFASLPYDRMSQVDNDRDTKDTLVIIVVVSFFWLFLGAFITLIKQRRWVSSNIMKKCPSCLKTKRPELGRLIPKDDTNYRQIHVKEIHKITEKRDTDKSGEPLLTQQKSIVSRGLLQVRDVLVGTSHKNENETESGPSTNEVRGLTLLLGKVYIVRQNENVIRSYDSETGSFYRNIVVASLTNVRDMTSCTHCRCLYVADVDNNTIHRIHLPSAEQKNKPEANIQIWPVQGAPESLYLMECSLIVSISDLKRIIILDKHGKQIWTIQLQQQPWHAIQLMDDRYVFSYTSSEEKEDRVCLIDKDGTVHSTFEGDVEKRLNKPGRMVATKSGYVFVADHNNDRIVLLDSKLEPINENMIKNITKPSRICFDEGRQRLFIASENETKDVFIYEIYRDL